MTVTFKSISYNGYTDTNNDGVINKGEPGYDKKQDKDSNGITVKEAWESFYSVNRKIPQVTFKDPSVKREYYLSLNEFYLKQNDTVNLNKNLEKMSELSIENFNQRKYQSAANLIADIAVYNFDMYKGILLAMAENPNLTVFRGLVTITYLERLVVSVEAKKNDSKKEEFNKTLDTFIAQFEKIKPLIEVNSDLKQRITDDIRYINNLRLK